MNYIFFNAKIVESTLLLIIVLALFVAQLPSTIVASYCLCVIVFVLKFKEVQFKRQYINFYWIIVALFFVSTLTFNHGVTPIFYLFFNPFLFWFAYKFSKNSLTHIELTLKNTYWIFVAFIFFALFANWGDPEPLGAILPWASTNGIPSYLIVLQITYSLSYYLKYDRLPLLSCFITLVVAVFGLGRGSMIVGTMILFFSFFINLTIVGSKKDRAVAYKVFLGLIMPVFFIINNNVDEFFSLIDLWIESSKFSSGVLDEHRGKILIDYINKIDVPQLLLGASYEQTSINDIYGGNPHNSYIRMHSFYGLFGILFVFLPLVAIGISRKKFIQKCVFLILIALALLRAISEPIFFPSTLDLFYFMYFLIFFKHAKNI